MSRNTEICMWVWWNGANILKQIIPVYVHVCQNLNIHTCSNKTESEKQNGDGYETKWSCKVADSPLLSQLQQLEQQLSAIENTAKVVQGELQASNQVRENSMLYMYIPIVHWLHQFVSFSLIVCEDTEICPLY